MKKLTIIIGMLIIVEVLGLFGLEYFGITEPRLATESTMDSEEQPEVAAAEEWSETVTTEEHPETVITEEQLKTDTPDGIINLPSYYNSLDEGKVNRTRDQGELGACWAFAVNTALESGLLPDEKWDFSEDHMIYNNGFDLDASEGGDYIMAIAYLAGWKGPVTEEDDPYADGYTNTDAVVVKHLQEALFIDGKDYDAIKKMVYKYGAVESSIYISLDENAFINPAYFNEGNDSYCYDGDDIANHEIVIIGWDDDYSKENFNLGATEDGAFICMNSWGDAFGNGGVFYVSYSDSMIGETAEVYTSLENVDNYDKIYQNDDCGWIGRVGFDKSSAFFANVYTASSDEKITAVSFYTTGKDTSYSVYVCPKFTAIERILSDKTVYAKGTEKYAGYHTIKLDKEIFVDAGERFAVIVEIDTPGSRHPVAIEMNGEDGRTRNVVTDDKESYISANGRAWEQTQENSSCNVCLKAFTNYR